MFKEKSKMSFKKKHVLNFFLFAREKNVCSSRALFSIIFIFVFKYFLKVILIKNY